MDTFEKLGAFYLGRPYDQESRKILDTYMLYDSKDLLTHAVCVGMTGSGKTGLCISLLEEAAIDNIPAIIIDPKGDMANLFLTFPDLKPADFEPWINPAEAATAGQTVQEFAANQAELWRNGLKQWDQDGSRIASLRDKVEMALYTPGSSAGLPVSVLQSLTSADKASSEDYELMLEQVSSTVSSLLSMLGLDADPVQSRDHILLSNILLKAWQSGLSVDIASLIGQIQNPPLDKIGVISLEDFYPSKDRFNLALQLNNLLASPRFAIWMEGQPLDIDSMLFNASGKPRLAIFSIAHLSESERMFFVTTLFNQVLSWTRRQSGTGSLRAIMYMDEIYGFCPPVANPPSKAPLLTLLKQARAYGLGVVLATQNPADLDYKGLSNTGTWFIGRLQTERDKMRVLEGLEGAAASQGMGYDRAQMDKLLSNLDKRVFLMNNVHDSQPTLFQTRWCMSYLRGPMTREHIQIVKGKMKESGVIPAAASNTTHAGAVPAVTGHVSAAPAIPAVPATSAASAGVVQTAGSQTANGVLPKLPAGLRQYVLPSGAVNQASDQAVDYQPMLLGYAQIGYRDTKSGLQENRSVALAVPINESVVVVEWDQAEELGFEIDQLDQDLPAGAKAMPLPESARLSKSYTAWKREYTDWLYRNRPLKLYHNPTFSLLSEPEESEREFQIRLQQQVRETRDLELEKLRSKYSTKMSSLEERIRKAEQAVEREKDSAKTQGLQTAISFGATLLSAFLGKKAVSAATLGKATTAVRGASRAMKEKGDVNRSLETVEAYKQQLADLSTQFEAETDALSLKMEEAMQDIQEYLLNPLKKDIMVKALVILWQPV